MAEPYLDRMEELLRHFFQAFHARIEEAGGMSRSQYVLVKLLAEKAPITVSEVAQHLGMTAAGATGLIDRLEKAGMVDRERDAEDRRVVRVTLNAEGRRQLAEARRLRRQVLADFFAPLSPDELAELIRLYEKVALHSVPFPESTVKE